jgi:hypothetical protein
LRLRPTLQRSSHFSHLSRLQRVYVLTPRVQPSGMPSHTVFAVITTVVKYVRTVLHQTGHFARPNSTKPRCRYVRYRSKCTIQIYHLYGQDIAKTFNQEKEPMSWHTPSNILTDLTYISTLLLLFIHLGAIGPCGMLSSCGVMYRKSSGEENLHNRYCLPL